MNKQNFFKNGGFPPIKYCSNNDKDNNNTIKTSKERFFSNAPKQNVNIRQLLNENKIIPLIIVDTSNDMLDVIDEI